MTPAPAPQVSIIGLPVAPRFDDDFAALGIGIRQDQPKLTVVEPPLRAPDRYLSVVFQQASEDQRRTGDMTEAQRNFDLPRTRGAASEPTGRAGGCWQSAQKQCQGKAAHRALVSLP